MRTIDELVGESPVFEGMTEEQLQLIAGCAQNAGFAAGERLFREGEPADTFYLVRKGRVALSTHAPARGPVLIETLDPGEIVGWSWIVPPYVWHFDARAVDDVRAVAFDGACLRGKCETDHALGYELMRRFGGVMLDRLQHTRLRLLDLYGRDGDS
jgi:CRP/FNR family transcriptional regulator, cyclic AMP receptor protein